MALLMNKKQGASSPFVCDSDEPQSFRFVVSIPCSIVITLFFVVVVRIAHS